MPWINPIAPTVLKTKPIAASQLSPEQKRARSVGDRLGVKSARKAANNHWEVLLGGELTIGGVKHKSLFIWPPHWEGVGEVFAAALEVDRKEAIAQPHTAPTKEADRVLLSIAYKSQTDNALNPGGSCNVTSCAMVLSYFGVEQQGDGQFEDELYARMQSEGWSRHDPLHLKRLMQAYGLRDDFRFSASIAELKASIDNGKPVIVHGYFTSFGHIVVLVGYDRNGFIVHDPYGEWSPGGYIRNDSANPARGNLIHYSYGLIERTCQPDGYKPGVSGCWAHFTSKPGAEASKSATVLATAKKYHPQEFRLNSVATAVIKSFEGLELSAYVCSAGVITIGMGTTHYPDGRPVQIGDRCTPEQAIDWFKYDSDRFIKALRDMVDVPLTGLQIAALTSFVYNCGEGAFEESTLRKILNQNAPIEAIEAQLRRWIHGGPGLVSRREAECALFRGEKDWERFR